MDIRKINPVEKIHELAYDIITWLETSRFSAEITNHGEWIKIIKVRLRYKKAYCGNHGRECVRPHIGPHKKMDYLEGADWVEFNDTLNNICDRLGISANITSIVCVIREGSCRRVEYDTINCEPGNEWARHGYLENWMGKLAPPSDFPEGTPGAYRDTYFCEG